jgi:hypothetical protein
MSAFAISPFVQSVNDVLFPIELFLIIFPILYLIFVPAKSASLQVSQDLRNWHKERAKLRPATRYFKSDQTHTNVWTF